MALDTKQKRGAVLNLTLPYRQWLAEPDGTLALADRQSLLKLGAAVSAAAGSHATSGALSAQAAAVVGAALHIATHATSGVLAAQAATVSGTAATAEDTHPTTGVLAADVAQVAGSATHLTLHATSGALVASRATVSGAGVSSAEVIIVPRRRAGGIRRNYIYKGKKYLNYTNEEIAALIRKDMIDITREDIRVTYKNKKPHLVSKNAWAELQATMKQLDQTFPVEEDDDEDIETILGML